MNFLSFFFYPWPHLFLSIHPSISSNQAVAEHLNPNSKRCCRRGVTGSDPCQQGLASFALLNDVSVNKSWSEVNISFILYWTHVWISWCLMSCWQGNKYFWSPGRAGLFTAKYVLGNQKATKRLKRYPNGFHVTSFELHLPLAIRLRGCTLTQVAATTQREQDFLRSKWARGCAAGACRCIFSYASWLGSWKAALKLQIVSGGDFLQQVGKRARQSWCLLGRLQLRLTRKGLCNIILIYDTSVDDRRCFKHWGCM